MLNFRVQKNCWMSKVLNVIINWQEEISFVFLINRSIIDVTAVLFYLKERKNLAAWLVVILLNRCKPKCRYI